MEITSLIASIVSVAIGILAIWLSIVFYKMSSQLSESTKEAAKDIGASVNRLEKLFDTLYSDTFSMMKDTVSDMRKHMWPEETKSHPLLSEETEKKADEKAELLKERVETELAQVLQRQSMTDSRLDSLNKELKALVSRAINESRKVEEEAREETVRENIIQELKSLPKRRAGITANDLVNRVIEKGFRFPAIIEEIEKMRGEGVVDFKDALIGPTTVVKLVNKN